MNNHENKQYKSPFCTRYSSKDMLYVFSEENKIKTWRRLWIALAKSEKELGLPITEEQIKELEDNVNIINYETAKKREKIVKHDVMAQIYAYSQQCPNASKIIHLGATSCYVTDNGSIIIMRQGLKIIEQKLLNLMKILSEFALKYKAVACLAYTHLQPAQLTTVGKRAALWLQDLYMDYLDISQLIADLKLLGSKGATGTQASFLNLFNNDEKKVKLLEMKIAENMDFSDIIFLSGQTYSRKVDFKISSVLSGIAQSAMKFANDMRILQSFHELEEPFQKDQIGSSAMPYKQNPMKSERICAIARYAIVNLLNPAFTAGTQWFERTLDDSANRRIVLPEIFLAIDSILNIMLNVSAGIVVNENVIKKRVENEIIFMATENIMMSATKKGGNRQNIHEELRKLCIQASNKIKKEGKENDLKSKILNNSLFKLRKDELDELLKPENFIGLSSRQVDLFIKEKIHPILERNLNEILNPESFDLLV